MKGVHSLDRDFQSVKKIVLAKVLDHAGIDPKLLEIEKALSHRTNNVTDSDDDRRDI